MADTIKSTSVTSVHGQVVLNPDGSNVGSGGSSFSSDTNSPLDNFYMVKASPAAFAGGTTNARGDVDGTSDPKTLFTVTGDVLLGVYGVCTVDLVSAGGGSVSVGLTGNTALLIPSTTATTIDANELWMDATPAIGKVIDSLTYYVVGNGVDVVEDSITADITAGQIYYICLWRPLSVGSTVVAA